MSTEAVACAENVPSESPDSSPNQLIGQTLHSARAAASYAPRRCRLPEGVRVADVGPLRGSQREPTRTPGACACTSPPAAAAAPKPFAGPTVSVRNACTGPSGVRWRRVAWRRRQGRSRLATLGTRAGRSSSACSAEAYISRKVGVSIWRSAQRNSLCQDPLVA